MFVQFVLHVNSRSIFFILCKSVASKRVNFITLRPSFIQSLNMAALEACRIRPIIWTHRTQQNPPDNCWLCGFLFLTSRHLYWLLFNRSVFWLRFLGREYLILFSFCLWCATCSEHVDGPINHHDSRLCAFREAFPSSGSVIEVEFYWSHGSHLEL